MYDRTQRIRTQTSDDLPLFLGEAVAPPPPPPKAQWYDLPANTRPSRCRSCDKLVYFTTTKNGRAIPVDANIEGGVHPIVHAAGRGVSHFQTCDDPKRFSTKGRR